MLVIIACIYFFWCPLLLLLSLYRVVKIMNLREEQNDTAEEEEEEDDDDDTVEEEEEEDDDTTVVATTLDAIIVSRGTTTRTKTGNVTRTTMREEKLSPYENWYRVIQEVKGYHDALPSPTQRMDPTESSLSTGAESLEERTPHEGDSSDFWGSGGDRGNDSDYSSPEEFSDEEEDGELSPEELSDDEEEGGELTGDFSDDEEEDEEELLYDLD